MGGEGEGGGTAKRGWQEVEGMNGPEDEQAPLSCHCAKAPTQQRRQPPAALVAGHAFILSPSQAQGYFRCLAPSSTPAPQRRWLPVKRLGLAPYLVAFFSSPFMQAHPLALPHHHPSFPLVIAKLTWTRQVPGLALPWPCNTLLNPSHRKKKHGAGRRTDHSLLAHDVQKINLAAWPWLLPRPLSSTLGQ